MDGRTDDILWHHRALRGNKTVQDDLPQFNFMHIISFMFYSIRKTHTKANNHFKGHNVTERFLNVFFYIFSRPPSSRYLFFAADKNFL